MKTIWLTLIATVLPIAACFSGELQVRQEERIVYIPKEGSVTRWRFVDIRYRGELSTEGYFDVNDSPTRLSITSDKPELLRIALIGDSGVGSLTGERYTFAKPGDVTIAVAVGGESRKLPVMIVELPVRKDAPSAEVIKTLGFPDRKRKIIVSWPDLEEIDSIIYQPDPSDTAIGEHWRYDALPGLVISVMAGKVYRVGSDGSFEALSKLERAKREAEAARKREEEARQRARAEAEAARKREEGARQRARAIEDAKTRIWTSGQHKIEAKFVSSLGGKVMLKRLDNGKEITVSRELLSKEDQEFIRERKWLEQLPENGSLPASRFVGRWRIVNNEGVTCAYFSLTASYEAKKDHAPNVTAKWEIVGNDARITWSDGWLDLLRAQRDKTLVLVYKPGTGWDDPPYRRHRAIRE